MKNIAFICSIVCLALQTGFSQTTKWINPAPTGNSIFDAVTTSSQIIGVGALGTILKSTDGGTSWSLVSSNTTRTLRRITAFGSQLWAVGDSGTVLKSVDSGNTWTSLNIATTASLLTINIVDATNGWIGGQNGSLWKLNPTTSTIISAFSSTTGTIVDILFTSPSKGHYTTPNKIYTTTNGGSSWSLYAIQSWIANTQRIYFSDANNGQVFGWGLIAQTTNGGANWNEISSNGTSPAYVSSISFSSLQNGMVTDGVFGGFFVTTNGGNDFYRPLPSLNNVTTYKTLPLSNGNILIFAAGGTIYRTNTAFSSINLVSNSPLSFTGTFYDVKIVRNSSLVFAVGDSGTIVRSADNGNTWTKQKLNVANTFYHLYFLNTSTGFIVGTKGSMYKTTDAGINWTLQPKFTKTDLNNVQYLNNSTGYMVGTSKYVYRTVNGGTSWDSLYINVFGIAFLQGLKFTDPNNGWVGANGALFFNTTNGGATWKSFGIVSASYPTINDFYIDPQNKNFIVVSGNDGLILRSNDGNTFSQSTTNTTDYLNNVIFTGNNTFLAAGGNGTWVQSNNNGISFTPRAKLTVTNIVASDFLSPNYGYLVGQNGLLLRIGTSSGSVITSVPDQDYTTSSNTPLENIFYPVPSKTTLFTKEPLAWMEIYTLQGEKILSSESVQTSLPLPNTLQSGIYLIRYQNEKGLNGMEKILIE